MSELCLKDQTVLTLKDIEGVPREILKINNPELLPICLKQNCTMENFQKWLKLRGIPDNREGLKEVIERFGSKWLTNKNYLSLSDHYWLKKRTENWKKVNFFTNTYSKNVGNMFFEPWKITRAPSSETSPDLTTNGIVRKKWIQNPDKTSYLVKAGSPETNQDPLNEVLVAALVEQLGVIDCVNYDLTIEGSIMCSKGDNFITVDTDLVPAEQIYYYEAREENESVFNHLVRMCELFDIPNAEEYLKWLVFIDKLTANTDRNLSNIGFIRDVNTMKFIGPAPMFDCGNAYWNTKNINNNAVKSNLFGDVEGNIYNELHKKCDLSSLKKDYGYKKLIHNYPTISNQKKDNLIDAITKRNNRLCKSDRVEEVER